MLKAASCGSCILRKSVSSRMEDLSLMVPSLSFLSQLHSTQLGVSVISLDGLMGCITLSGGKGRISVGV